VHVRPEPAHALALNLRSRLLAACVALAVLVVAPSVSATEPTAHVTWRASVRWSDNILGAPKPGPNVPENAPRPVADLGFEFTPGGALVYLGGRARWVLGYSHPMLLYVRHPLAHSSGDALTFAGSFVATPLDGVDVEASLVRSTSTLNSLVEPTAERIVGPVRSAAANLVRASSAVRHRHEWSERWQSLADLRMILAMPLDDGAGLFTLSGALAARVLHARHAFDLAATALYGRVVGGARATTTRVDSSQLLLGPELRWTWDVTTRFSTQATLGVVAPVVGLSEVTTRPVATAYVGYDHQGYAATVGYARAYVPSSLSAQLFFSDTFSLRGRVPVSREYFLDVLSGTGLSRSRMLDTVRGLDSGAVTTFVLDAGLAFARPRWPQLLLSYQWTHQVGPAAGQLLLPSFDRSVVSLGVEFMFPPPSAWTLTPMGVRRRVDGNDKSAGER